MLSALKVVHVIELHHSSEENPLVEFRTNYQPFMPSTCARQVYILNEPQALTLDTLMSYLSENAKKAEYFQGEEAYLFLLRWAVGSESWKLGGNDHFVLGSLRQKWTYHRIESSKALNLEPLMSMLFEDASKIRACLEQHKVPKAIIKESLQKMARNCTTFRANGQIPIFEGLLLDSKEEIEEAQLKAQELEMVRLKKQMNALNLNAKDDLLMPSQITSHQRTPVISMFKQNLESALKKKNLETQLRTLRPDKF
jgi:hypothetical protein